MGFIPEHLLMMMMMMMNVLLTLVTIISTSINQLQFQLQSINFFLLQGYPGMCSLLGGLVALGMHYAMRAVMDMGQQTDYSSLEWNWPKEAMNRPIGAGLVDGAKLF